MSTDNRTPFPTFSIENITPELAAEYLKRNTANRPKKPTKIALYARDMAAGNWLMTGEPIKFCPAGVLRDGQNRLYAVIEADVTVTMVVGRNIPPEAMVVMDAGAPRTRGDALFLTGHASGKDLAAAANVHHAWGSGVLKTAMSGISNAHRLTNIETVQYIEKHPDLVEAVRAARGTYPALRLPIGSLAVAHDALRRINPEEALDFFDRINEMRTTGKGDPVATLIKRVASDGAVQRRILPATGLYYLFTAWNAVRSDQRIGKFQIGSAMNGWNRIPEPK